MSEMIHKNIRNPKFLSEDDICRPVSAGAMTIQNCAVMRPLPCIVILVHGVNDVGEAYQDQDTGICAGLNSRLGRQDLHPHFQNIPNEVPEVKNYTGWDRMRCDADLGLAAK